MSSTEGRALFSGGNSGSPFLGRYGVHVRVCPSDLFFQGFTVFGNHGLHGTRGNSLVNLLLCLAFDIKFLSSTSGAHFHPKNYPETSTENRRYFERDCSKDDAEDPRHIQSGPSTLAQSGGAILSSHCTHHSQLPICIHSLVTVCCVYLPPNDVVPQVDLNQLVSQLPAPFILLGDFNGHSPQWGHDDTNSRGRQIEQLISDHCLCLLNNDEKTYFHAPTRTFHSLDLAICSPTLLPMLNFEVANDLHNSDHFPLLVSHVNGAGTRFRPPTYYFHRADWDKFTRLAIISGTMVQNRAVDEAVFTVTEAIRNAADAAIPKTSNSLESCANHGGTLPASSNAW
ncbi:putative RNA-directed DNA polymerase from transposon X-element, partial [Trichonephila clavipes]